MKKIVANTFTPLYDAIEDRIRLVVNYDDYQNRVDLMITRSFILDLIPSIEEFYQKHYDVAVSDEMALKVEQNVSPKQNATVETDSANLQLFQKDEQLLQEINLSFDANTQHTAVTFRTKEGVVVSRLDAQTFRDVIKILKSAIPYVAWGISYHF
jgi:hypothetical protein